MRMNKEKQDVTPQKEFSGHGSESIGQMLESSSKNIKRRGPNPFPSFLCSGSSEHKPLSTPIETSGESQSMLIKKWQKAYRHKGTKKTTTEQTLFFTKKPQTTEMQMGKLLVMNLTSRNKSNLVFDEDKLTTTSIPVCPHCCNVFENFPALGGHIRICKAKVQPQLNIQDVIN